MRVRGRERKTLLVSMFEREFSEENKGNDSFWMIIIMLIQLIQLPN